MDKQTLLSTITSFASQNLLTKEEVVSAYESGKGEKPGLGLTRNMGISEMLYFIGGFIVFVGISILIFQNWSSLSAFTKILTTLGFGIAAYSAGVVLTKEEKYGALPYAFHLIGALTIPLGLGVVFNQAGYDATTNGWQSLISGFVLFMYSISYLVFKKPIFTFFSIAYATWFFFVFTNFLIGSNPVFDESTYYQYRFLVVGVSYICLGYYFATTEQKDLTGALYGFGSLFGLGAALILGGWEPSQNLLWEFIFPFLVAGVLYLSVIWTSKAFLVFGTIYLMAFIFKITGEYFSGTLGWPISLMICGMALIVTGYYAFTLNKKYLSSH